LSHEHKNAVHEQEDEGINKKFIKKKEKVTVRDRKESQTRYQEIG
jgi:hypothetical protein